MSSYAQRAYDALYDNITEDGEDLNEQDSVLALLYTTLVLTKGEDTTLEDVHDAWSVWAARHEPWRQSLVPFAELPEHIQAYDEPYRDGIHAAASEIKETTIEDFVRDCDCPDLIGGTAEVAEQQHLTPAVIRDAAARHLGGEQ